MNFSSRSLALTLLIIIAIVLGYFVLKPKWSEYATAKAQVVAAQEQKDKLLTAQKQLNEFLTEYKSHSQTAALLNQSLPLSKTEITGILNNLDILTKTSGLALGQLSIVETPESDQLGAVSNSIQPIDLSLNGSGTFEAFKNFLGKLETNLRIMDISNINVDGSSTSEFKFIMSFRTYYQK